jgi:hypothetical protein
LENQSNNLPANTPAAPLENQPGSANSGPPVLVIDDRIEAEELPEYSQIPAAAATAVVADPSGAGPSGAGPSGAGPGPDTSQVKVVTVNAAAPGKN